MRQVGYNYGLFKLEVCNDAKAARRLLRKVCAFVDT